METRPILVMGIALFLSGACSTTPFENTETRFCPSLVDYEEDLRIQAASEIEQLPAKSAVIVMLRDYSALRDQVRACLAGTG